MYVCMCVCMSVQPFFSCLRHVLRIAQSPLWSHLQYRVVEPSPLSWAFLHKRAGSRRLCTDGLCSMRGDLSIVRPGVRSEEQRTHGRCLFQSRFVSLPALRHTC